jgi:hypothetical protein
LEQRVERIEKELKLTPEEKAPAPEISAQSAEENAFIVEQYIMHCEKRKATLPLFAIDREIVDEYLETVPALQEAREKFENASDSMHELMMKDEEYKKIREELRSKRGDEEARRELKKEMMSIYRRLYETNEEYRKAKDQRDELLRISNKLTLEYMLDDYSKRGMVFPIDWIPPEKVQQYLKRYREGKR